MHPNITLTDPFIVGLVHLTLVSYQCKQADDENSTTDSNFERSSTQTCKKLRFLYTFVEENTCFAPRKMMTSEGRKTATRELFVSLLINARESANQPFPSLLSPFFSVSDSAILLFC